jgi:hypothetical protein
VGWRCGKDRAIEAWGNNEINGSNDDNDNFEGCSRSHGVTENCMNESRVANSDEGMHRPSV